MGTCVVQTAQNSDVAGNLLTIMKFGLDESTRRKPKGGGLPVRWLVYCTDNWLLGDKTFFTAKGSDHKCSVVTSTQQTV